MVICIECQKEFEDDSGLHRHLRAHDLHKEEYYHKYFPRHDLFTKELLEFRSQEYYFGNWFANRANCINYIKQLPDNASKQKFIRELFANRKTTKELLYQPSQVELRSSILPSANFVSAVGLNYDELAKELSLINKYDYSVKRGDLKFHNEPLEIIQDTREQTPLRFSDRATVIRSGLDFCDYTCRSHFSNVFIERKSPMDFIATFSNQVERFEREIKRATLINATIIVLVEFDFEDAMSFDQISYINKRTKIVPEYVFHNVRELIQTYPNLQFGFCDGRKEMTEIIEKIYSCQSNIVKYDIQFLIDLGFL
jgi:hypothetical protein